MGIQPNAVSISPAKAYLGPNGNWSTFSISIGNPPQQVNVLPSTLIPTTWAISTTACSISDPPNCSQLRGNLFSFSQSTSWKDQKTWSLSVENAFGWNPKDSGDFGFDDLTLASPAGAVGVHGSVIASLTNVTDSYTGLLGLAARNVTLSENTPSLLAIMRNANQIPSLSYSYTAGAEYNTTLGALTLGGYDASSFNPNGVSFGFGPTDDSYLTVGLETINLKSSNSSDAKTIPLLADPITTLIDSTIAQLWLPRDVCDAFADAFGLTYDGITSLYKVNDTARATNLKNNPSVQMQIGNTAANGPTVTINFPYSAFDLKFFNPNDADADPFSYFPIRRASASGPNVLGRTFFQEAVVTVDFERENFTIAQALYYPPTQSSKIVNIISPSDESSITGGPNPTGAPSPSSTAITTVPSPASFPTGAIAGIVIGVVALVAGIIAFFMIKKHHSKGGPKRLEEANPETPGAQRPPPVVDEKPLPPELGGKADDYFSQQPYHQKNVSITESEMNELPSPRGGTYIPEHHGTPVIIASPAELPAGHDPTAPELHSESHTRNTSISSGLAPSGLTWLANSPPSHSPINENSPAISADPGWNTSHIEPGSPASAMSVSMRGVGRAHIRTLRSPTGNSPPLPLNEFTGMVSNVHDVTESGMPFNGLGIGTLQRHGSHHSQNSQSTLVGGLSGRQSPIQHGQMHSQTPSAFQSPELAPQTVPNRRPVPTQSTAQQQTPGELEEERR